MKNYHRGTEIFYPFFLDLMGIINTNSSEECCQLMNREDLSVCTYFSLFHPVRSGTKFESLTLKLEP